MTLWRAHNPTDRLLAVGLWIAAASIAVSGWQVGSVGATIGFIGAALAVGAIGARLWGRGVRVTAETVVVRNFLRTVVITRDDIVEVGLGISAWAGMQGRTVLIHTADDGQPVRVGIFDQDSYDSARQFRGTRKRADELRRVVLGTGPSKPSGVEVPTRPSLLWIASLVVVGILATGLTVTRSAFEGALVFVIGELAVVGAHAVRHWRRHAGRRDDHGPSGP